MGGGRGGEVVAGEGGRGRGEEKEERILTFFEKKKGAFVNLRECLQQWGCRHHFFRMAEEGKPDAQLFELLTHFVQQVESLSNVEEVELRAKIEALGLEVTKVPPKPSKDLGELEIAAELDKLSARIDYVDKMISSAIAEDPEVKSLLSSTSDVWMPVITATADQRRGFAGTSSEGEHEEQV